MAAFAVFLFCILTPFFILWLIHVNKIASKLGGIMIAYIIGCSLAFTGVIPSTPEVRQVQTLIINIAIPLAIPLMLFSSDVKSWGKFAPNFIKSTLFAVIGCVLSLIIGFYLFGGSDHTLYANIGGMLTGLFTGGNANLAALKMVLNVDEADFVMVSAYSTVLTGVYIMLILFVGPKLLKSFMPAIKEEYVDKCESMTANLENFDDQLFYGLFRKDNLRDLFFSFALTLVILFVGYFFSTFFSGEYQTTVWIFSVSFLAVMASFIPQIRSLKRTFEAGSFLILVFSLAISSKISPSQLTSANHNILYFVLLTTFGTVFFHVLLGWIFRVDADTTLVTSISLICSPPFVPVMATAIKNKSIIGPGIAVGLLGYAVGTYLGFIVAKFLLLL